MRSSVLLAGLGMLLVAQAVSGAEWITEPSLAYSGEYNDNLFLTTQPHDTLFLNSVKPAVRVEGRSETLSVGTDAWLRFDRYPGEADANSNNGGLRFDSAMGGEVQHADLVLDFAQDTTLQTELLDTGLTQSAKQRRSALVAPAWYYHLNQDMSLGADYGYSTVNYESGTGLYDYRYQSFSGSMAHEYSTTTEWSLALFGADYKTEDDVSQFWNAGIQAGVVHDFSERSHGRIAAGVRHTTSRNELVSGVFRDESTGGVVDAKLEHQFDRARINLQASRDIQPSGGGYLQQSDRVSAGWWHPVTPQWRLSLYASAYHHKSLTDYRTPYDRHYQLIEPRIEWHWADEWVIGGYARYARSKYAQDPDTAEANVVGAQVMYRWSGANL